MEIGPWVFFFGRNGMLKKTPVHFGHLLRADSLSKDSDAGRSGAEEKDQ